MGRIVDHNFCKDFFVKIAFRLSQIPSEPASKKTISTFLREYFFGNLDPCRYGIQQDIDIPLTQDLGNAELVTTRNTLQIPDAICDFSDNPSLKIAVYWTVTLTKGFDKIPF